MRKIIFLNVETVITAGKALYINRRADTRIILGVYATEIKNTHLNVSMLLENISL